MSKDSKAEYADGAARAIVRPILDWPRGKDGFTQPKTDDWEQRRGENAARMRAVFHGFYADPYIGNGRMYDPTGNYRCEACNMAEDVECVMGDMKRIDRKAGSCEHWEDICAGDPEPRIKLPWKTMAYGVAKNGEGFGCHRCGWGSDSIVGPDERGRNRWCGFWGCRVDSKACCRFNNAPSIELDANGVPVAAAAPASPSPQSLAEAVMDRMRSK